MTTNGIATYLQEKLLRIGFTIKFNEGDNIDNSKGIFIHGIFDSNRNIEVLKVFISEIGGIVAISLLVSNDLKKDDYGDGYILKGPRKHKGLATYIVYMTILYCALRKKAIHITGIKAGADKYWNRFGIPRLSNGNYESNSVIARILIIYFQLWFSYLRYLFYLKK